MRRRKKLQTAVFQQVIGDRPGGLVIKLILLLLILFGLFLLPRVSLAGRLPDSNAGTIGLDDPAQVSKAVARLQKSVLPPGLAVDYASSAPLPDAITSFLTEVNPQGLHLESDGRLTGRVTPVPANLRPAEADLLVIPTIRNWNKPGADSPTEITDLLLNNTSRADHITAITELLQQEDYDGIDLDYRGIDPTLRREYTAFLAELRRTLPDDKSLSVRLDLPHQLSTGAWDTGAYDWPAIGRLADRVKLPVSPDPRAYNSGGEMEQMLDWAVDQIDRYKLQLLIRPNSARQVDGLVQELDYKEALAQIGRISTVETAEIFDPGQKINFILSGPPASTGIRVDRDTGTYWFAYLDRENRHHTVYLENAAGLAEPLALAAEYHLQGVAMQNLSGRPADDPVWAVIRSFYNATDSTTDTQYTVRWQVREQTGRTVAQATVDLRSSDYQWTAPDSGGAFEIEAGITSNHNATPVSMGKLAVLVATPTPTPAPPAAPKSQPAQPRNQPVPPAVPSVNVPFGYGIQADPRGDVAANVGHIKALGFTWVKLQMPWKDVESAPGDYTWGMWDQLVNAYHGNGIQLLLSIPKAPDWARPFDDDKSVEGPPEDPAKYAEFVGKVAGRYAGKVQAIEVWNEQNLWYEAGGMGRINAANYVQLLQLSYRTIKEANPEMIVVSGALTPAGNVGAAAVDDIEYLNQMYANGAKGFFDALGAHPSGYNCPANGDWRSVQDPTATNFRGTFDNRHHSWCFRGTMEGYREVMVLNGDGDKAIVPTEFGWAVSNQPRPGYEYAQDNTPEEQAQWIVEAYQMAKRWGWVGPMFLWNLDYGITAPGTELAAFGIIDTPAYHALANMPK